jgi:hypothetical protein
MQNNRAHELRKRSFSLIDLSAWQKCAISFLILMAMELPFVQPIQKKETKAEEARSAGDMVVEIEWPGCKTYEQGAAIPVCAERLDIDVDLWVKSPDDERPVGYSNRSGKTFSLLRDDVGTANDTTDRNAELASTRGLPAGEYIVNVHYFRSGELDKTLEIPVTVLISTKTKVGNSMRGIITRKATLRVLGEEITVVRFIMREDGELDPESVNDFYQELRAWQPLTR